MKLSLTLTLALFAAFACCFPAFATKAPDSDDAPLDNATRFVWELGQASLIDAEQSSRSLQAQVENFLTEPTAANLEVARREWRTSHQLWQQHSLWITLANGAPNLPEMKRDYFDLEARDLEPGYLDAVQNYPFSGIVNDISIVLTADNLRQQNGLTDDSEVSLGFHALEFLLWGDNGLRSSADFQAIAAITNEQNAAGLTVSDLPQNRRRLVLRLITQILVEDMQNLRQDWQNPNSTLSQSYLTLSPMLRLGLLQQASQQLLARDLPEQLHQLTSLDKTDQHNRFAGDNHQLTLAALSSLETLLDSGQQPLVNWLISPNQRADWQQRLQLQVATLNEVSEDDELVGRAKIAQVREQLLALAGDMQVASITSPPIAPIAELSF